MLTEIEEASCWEKVCAGCKRMSQARRKRRAHIATPGAAYAIACRHLHCARGLGKRDSAGGLEAAFPPHWC